ncbi:hypothetical protein RRG08_008033 [Elysia crispata]|uniref:Uncharacterized protein n=1 Tax=Elysia crispata TaxID=231223 RepID=A0AAE1AHF1_9GAST|nr:hypothetical protein RRG08_008033 [Elysia crispata]
MNIPVLIPGHRGRRDRGSSSHNALSTSSGRPLQIKDSSSDPMGSLCASLHFIKWRSSIRRGYPPKSLRAAQLTFIKGVCAMRAVGADLNYVLTFSRLLNRSHVSLPTANFTLYEKKSIVRTGRDQSNTMAYLPSVTISTAPFLRRCH